MASQGKVTDFFSTRKRNPGSQPSKRRKVEIQATEVDISTLNKTNVNPFSNAIQDLPDLVRSPVDNKKENVFSPLQTRAGRKNNANTTLQSSKKTRTRKTKVDPKQKLISDTFNGKDITDKAEPKKAQVSEEVTSAEDDHDEAQAAETPKKQMAGDKTKSRKRTRQAKAEQVESKADEATPEKRQVAEKKPAARGRAKKKLEMKEPEVHIQCIY